MFFKYVLVLFLLLNNSTGIKRNKAMLKLKENQFIINLIVILSLYKVWLPLIGNELLCCELTPSGSAGFWTSTKLQ